MSSLQQVRRVRRDATSDRWHGRLVRDPYRWLEDGDAAETATWLDEQRARFVAARDSWPLRPQFRRRITELLGHTSWSVPADFPTHTLATRSEGLRDHPELVIVRGDAVVTLVDPLVLDPTGATQLDAWAPSPDGRLVAVQTSRGGTEQGTLVVLDLDGRVVDGPIDRVRYSSVAWLGDGSGFFYIRAAPSFATGTAPAPLRGVWLHRLGGEDVCIREPTGRTAPIVRGEPTGRWLIVSESHGTNHRNDLWIADLAGIDPAAAQLRPVQQGIDADTSARIGPDGWLYLLTSSDAPRRRLCRVRPERPDDPWETVIAEQPDATLDEFAVLHGELLTLHRRHGRCELTRHDADGPHPVPLPDEHIAQGLTATAQHDRAYVSLAGVTTPGAVHVVARGVASPWRAAREVVDTAVTVTRTHYPAPDGTPIPLTVLDGPDVIDGPRPTILHAYGGHGSPRRLGFSASLLAWLEAGGRYAIAHVRGGGDEGRDWHRAATRTTKITTITDLIAGAQALVALGHTTAGQLCLSGGSQGGLVVLAAAVRDPSICNAVIAHAPLADMVRSELMGLGANWTEEFGSVEDPAEFAAMLAYSPYHNVTPGTDYPAVLLTGFHGDTRTGAAHPRKMCAALQHAQQQDAQQQHAEPGRPTVLRYAFDAGHARGALSRAIDLAADVHAFAAGWTGLTSPDQEARTDTKEEQPYG